MDNFQIKQYLDRINVAERAAPDLAFLQHLQWQHFLNIPFENLDIARKTPIRLKESGVFDKLISRKRGGFCYELNGLFGTLLRSLGYNVDFISASVYNKEKQRFGRPLDHLALLVTLDQVYLVDVGFGDSIRQPLPLTGDIREDVSGRYRIVPFDYPAQPLLLQKADEAGWQQSYRFSIQPRLWEDFTEACVYQQTSPESHFTHGDICTIATAEGRITYSNDGFTMTDTQGKRKVELTSDAALQKRFQEYFGIDLAFQQLSKPA